MLNQFRRAMPRGQFRQRIRPDDPTQLSFFVQAVAKVFNGVNRIARAIESEIVIAEFERRFSSDRKPDHLSAMFRIEHQFTLLVRRRAPRKKDYAIQPPRFRDGSGRNQVPEVNRIEAAPIESNRLAHSISLRCNPLVR